MHQGDLIGFRHAQLDLCQQQLRYPSMRMSSLENVVQ